MVSPLAKSLILDEMKQRRMLERRDEVMGVLGNPSQFPTQQGVEVPGPPEPGTGVFEGVDPSQVTPQMLMARDIASIPGSGEKGMSLMMAELNRRSEMAAKQQQFMTEFVPQQEIRNAAEQRNVDLHAIQLAESEDRKRKADLDFYTAGQTKRMNEMTLIEKDAAAARAAENHARLSPAQNTKVDRLTTLMGDYDVLERTYQKGFAFNSADLGTELANQIQGEREISNLRSKDNKTPFELAKLNWWQLAEKARNAYLKANAGTAQSPTEMANLTPQFFSPIDDDATAIQKIRTGLANQRRELRAFQEVLVSEGRMDIGPRFSEFGTGVEGPLRPEVGGTAAAQGPQPGSGTVEIPDNMQEVDVGAFFKNLLPF